VACRAAVLVAAALGVLTSASRATAQSPTIDAGRELFLISCSSCHGVDARGTSEGPSLLQVGAASADFQLSTGRMPLDDPRAQAARKKPELDAVQIDEITRYVASLGSGPAIPQVHPEAGDLARGGQLFTLNCAACHSAAASGGSLGRGLQVPSLHAASATQIGEAIRTGPGSMPKFGPDSLSDADVSSVARYVLYLRSPQDRGGLSLGRVGPIPEGFVAWLVGLGALLFASRWIGERE
jgi:quinol---cytochrome-c reductase cytochrome c subunit